MILQVVICSESILLPGSHAFTPVNLKGSAGAHECCEQWKCAAKMILLLVFVVVLSWEAQYVCRAGRRRVCVWGGGVGEAVSPWELDISKLPALTASCLHAGVMTALCT